MPRFPEGTHDDRLGHKRGLLEVVAVIAAGVRADVVARAGVAPPEDWM